MNYKEAMSFLDGAKIYGSVLSLENMINLMNEFMNIQDKLKVIHIAGTNGKGSVGAFLSEILKSSGYKTGRYISPTILEYTEKFQINGKFIEKNTFADICGQVKKAVDKIVLQGKNHPTVFEIETAVAFLYFYSEKCDFILLETGMGGKLDATNIIKNNICSVLTSISIDHTDFLGNSLEEITEEKCGIIKNGSPVVSVFQNDKVMRVIEKNCEKKNARLIKVIKDSIVYNGIEDYCQIFNYKKYINIKIKLLGKFQIENASLAIEVVELLMEKGYNIIEKNIYSGLFNAVWPGRFQILRKTPVFVADGAHNADAAKRLAENLKLYFNNKRIVFIVGIFKDKDYKKIAALTAKSADKVFVFTLKNPRALNAEILAKEFIKYNKNVFIVSSVKDAVLKSIPAAGKNGVVVAFGSLSYMGEIIKIAESKL